MTPKYPDVYVPLVGEDSNAFSIISRAVNAAKRADVPKEEIDVFRFEAISGDYNQLLQTVMKWFHTDPAED